MKVTTKTSLVGFLLALSALNVPKANGQLNLSPPPNGASATVEERLGAIAAALKSRTDRLQDLSQSTPEGTIKERDNSLAQVSPWRNGPIWNDGTGFGNWRNNWRDFKPFVDFRNVNPSDY